ncbi:hypothetical protein [Ectothiorhodospira shaposhnikovii]|uniref:hypothetical protein n=1 Tax=Ectothiorhodospira shaposhnikovii TaxID=1054 RepID=UPI001EE8425E|nr:hypothetical protein [Ectothiorhodospira shaposhnikovii]MCG5512848.1 hypothetical protein [Ectothiorhodospira shaposhnikovii]
MRAPAPRKPGSSSRRLGEADWIEAATLWESGNYTLEDLSNRFGISKEALSKGFKKRGSEKGAKSKEYAEKVKAAIGRAAEEEALIHAQRVMETREKSYEWIMALTKMAMSEAVSAAKARVPIATKLDNLKAIEKAMNVVSTGSNELFRVLNIKPDDIGDDQLPELTISEMTADEIAAVQRAASGDDEDLDLSDLEDDLDDCIEGDEEEEEVSP